MKGIPRGWLFEGDAREEIDRAIAERVRDQGDLPRRGPTVITRTMERNDGSEFEGTVVFIDDDGWWCEYARSHAWPEFTGARMRELYGEEYSDTA